jgi:ArsR family transcriptional regulator
MDDQASLQDLLANAEEASAFLKAIANPHRLVVLCLLADNELNVSELEKSLNMRQPALSQQLARLREDGMVETRREGKSVYYRLASDEALALIRQLHRLFCAIPKKNPAM